MAAWISTKNCTAMGLDMPHLVWKFYEKSCFSFLDMARKRKKWTKNNNNNNKKELDQNQESSPLLRWSLTRQLQSLVTVRELTSIETRQTGGLAIGWIDKTRLGQTFNLSYHMIDSDGKSQSHNSKYAILSHNILICLSELLG